MIRPAAVAFLFCVLSLLTGPASDGETIPFCFEDGFIRVDVEVDASRKPLCMLLDSGASVSVLNLATAEKLRLARRSRVLIQGVSSDSEASQIEPLKARVSGVDCGSIELAADMSHAWALCSTPIDGLIGVDFFRDRVVQIDYLRQLLRILPKVRVGGSALRLPLKVINDVPCVGVGVNGSSARWTRLDTGCNESLHWVVPRRSRQGKSLTASIGFVTEEREVFPGRVTLGNLALSSIPVALHGRQFFEGEAGLLGNGILSKFTVTVDWPGQAIFLEPRASRQNE